MPTINTAGVLFARQHRLQASCHGKAQLKNPKNDKLSHLAYAFFHARSVGSETFCGPRLLGAIGPTRCYALRRYVCTENHIPGDFRLHLVSLFLHATTGGGTVPVNERLCSTVPALLSLWAYRWECTINQIPSRRTVLCLGCRREGCYRNRWAVCSNSVHLLRTVSLAGDSLPCFGTFLFSPGASRMGQGRRFPGCF